MGSMGKWLLLGLGWKVYKMSLQPPIASESKDVHRNVERKKIKTEICLRDTGVNRRAKHCLK